MFRKHFRFKRFALGLAFAALVVPVSSASAASLSIFVDGGPAPVSITPVSSDQPSYLRYHEVGAPVAAGPTIRSENAAIASRVTPPSVAISERSNGVQGPDPSLVPQLALSTSSGFDWSDAGIGASTVLGTTLLLGLALVLIRRNQHGGLTQA